MSFVYELLSKLLKTGEPASDDQAIPVRITGPIPSGVHSVGYVYPRPSATAGCDLYRKVSAATTNAASIKSIQGQVYGWSLINTSGAAKYVKLYDKSSAPTVGTDVPLLTIMIPATSSVVLDSGIGISFASGIAIAITGAVTDADPTAVGSAEVYAHIWYH